MDTRILEISNAQYDAEKDQTTVTFTNYDLSEGGVVTIKSRQENRVVSTDGVNLDHGILSKDDLIAYGNTQIIPEVVNKVVFSQESTVSQYPLN